MLPLLPLYSFMHRSILLSSFHSCLYDCSPVPTIICGCLPCRSVDSRHFHVAFACISVAEIRTAYCTRSSDELTIQHVFWDAPVSHSMDMAKPSQTPMACPQDMRDANIVTLYKNKGDRSDCNNYRGISLLSVVGKVFARVALTKLQILAERTLPESQCGFRTGRSTIDMIFSVRQLQEKCREQRRPLFIAFIDLTKAFDLVSRRGLFNLLEKIGCPPKLLSVISSFHNNMKGTVNYDGATSVPFDIHSGVKQGCVLAPTLFSIFFSMMLSYAFNTSTEGVFLPVSILGFENCQSFFLTTAHVRTVCRNARRTAMRGAPQCAARTSLIGTTLAKLSKQLRNITYRQLFNKHTILSCLFLKMIVYCNKQLCK